MKKYIDILRNCPLFYDISDENLITLLGCLGAKVERFGKKQTIIAEGTKANSIGVILSGSAQSVTIDYYGNRSIVSSIGRCEVFCEAFACADVASIPIAIIANEPCEVMLIEFGRIMNSCAKACGFHHKLVFNLMRDIADKNIMFHHKIAVTSKRTTRDKLLSYLAQQARIKCTNSFEIPFNRQELADYLEVERSGLSAEISKLRKEGIIQAEKKHFTLL
ncbi:MAG: Crp/Fnr family transcriptional regulator [Oscillospiraceae bacterium]